VDRMRPCVRITKGLVKTIASATIKKPFPENLRGSEESRGVLSHAPTTTNGQGQAETTWRTKSHQKKNQEDGHKVL